MVKNLLLIALAGVLFTSCNQGADSQKTGTKFTVSGTVDTIFNGMIYLQKRVESPLVSVDSSELNGGKFEFKGTIDVPEVYYLTIPALRSSVPFFLEASDIMVDINTKQINRTKISGSETQDDYDRYLDTLDRFNAKIRENYQMYNTALEYGENEKARKFDSLVNVYDMAKTDYSKNYVLDNPKSFISPYILYRNSYSYEVEELEEALSKFDTSLAASVYTGYMQSYLKTLQRTAVGKKFLSFFLPDTNGNNVFLLDKIGKNYLLLDFWASWCAPCREENPNLVALYNKYRESGFDILAVSLDNKQERWTEAIRKDKLAWTHVSDLKGWESSAGKLYGIRSIPANLLIDKEGTIIARNLRGEELSDKLAELFPETN